ncbi:hypothetical protein NDU88_002437 [Pleurodeles waltl]|uniref:Uncharacterized protein n=1 Tax=Pleurodeles waltl TaxID=8319 RepID=A0AAV7KUS2_PLEWA|nr:hypothetical protein NDU88_002437 [Pleurodeles waltl]
MEWHPRFGSCIRHTYVCDLYLHWCIKVPYNYLRTWDNLPMQSLWLFILSAQALPCRAAALHSGAAGEAAARVKGRSTLRAPFLRPRILGRTRQDQRTQIGSRSLLRWGH